jgi:hypothetical protein
MTTTAMLGRRTILGGLGAFAVTPAFAQPRPRLRDGFRQGLDQWVIEAEKPARVVARDGVLDIDAPAGLTLWFKPMLAGPIAIDYSVQAVSAGGPHDRVSDINCFWMATDPAVPDGDVLARSRTGKFADYDDLRTYYVGLGGNTNTTTRFRRYIGRPGDRPLLPENDRQSPADLIVPNAWQHLRLIADGERISFARDGRTLFSYRDPTPYTRGRFALRTTQSHLRVRDFVVHKLA